jgi:hypothetical protein
MCRERGGKGSPGVITLMNPGPYRPLYLWGWHVELELELELELEVRSGETKENFS